MIRQTGKAWSGAQITPRNGKMIVEVSGQWKVPEVALPSGIGIGDENRILCSCSTWIGLDGARNHLHSTLPQIGTIQQVVVRNGQPKPECFLFREWWCDGHLSGPTNLGPVNPGDRVTCRLKVVSSTQVEFSIKLDSVSTPVENSLHAPELPVPGTSSPRIQRLISGQTAQWITERPANPESHNLVTGEADERFVLARYSPVVFEQCIAIAASGPESTSDREELSLAGAGVTLRDMVQIRDNRVEVISKAELLQEPDEVKVRTSYLGPA